MELNLEQVQQFLETNKENDDVKTYLGKLSAPTVDGVKGFLESHDDGKKLFQSLSDSRVTQGIESFKKNNLEKLIEDEIKKRNPSKTPEQIELEKLRADFENSQKQLQLKEVKEKATSIASEKKIPLELLDFFINSDEEKTKENLSTFENVMDKYVKAQVDERLKGSYTPPAGGTDPQGVSKEQFQKMGYLERVKLKQDNPDLYDKLTRN